MNRIPDEAEDSEESGRPSIQLPSIGIAASLPPTAPAAGPRTKRQAASRIRRV